LLAILKRPRPIGRDFYDVIFLFVRAKPNYRYLKEKIGLKFQDYLKEITTMLLTNCKELNFKKLVEYENNFYLIPKIHKKYCYLLNLFYKRQIKIQ